MSRNLGPMDEDFIDFKNGDNISFLHEGERLIGRVVRVYNSRLLYHVLVDGMRYEVEIPQDDPRRA